jgi:hypothetical protein
MEYILIGWIACGVTTSYIAKQKGKNSWAWLGLGLLFPLFSLIAICAVPAQPSMPATVVEYTALVAKPAKPVMAPADKQLFLVVMLLIGAVAYMLHSLI